MKVGFYGLDIYSLWDSLRAIMRYLREKGDMTSLTAARHALQCFEAFGEDAQEYAHAMAFVPHHCRDEVALMLRELRNRVPGAMGTAAMPSSWPNRTPWWCRTPRPTTARCSTATPRPGTSATSTWPRRSTA